MPAQLSKHRIVRARKVLGWHRGDNRPPLVSFWISQRIRRVRTINNPIRAIRYHQISDRFSSTKSQRVVSLLKIRTLISKKLHVYGFESRDRFGDPPGVGINSPRHRRLR